MMLRDFGMGFFGRMPFGSDPRKELFEKWSAMTPEEKVEFMDKRMEALNNGKREAGGFFGQREFTVASIDQRCEEWLKKTPEEKEAFIKERKEMMNKRFGGGLFGGCSFETKETPTEEK